ncbi:MAG: flavin reductase [Acidobacteria bacterium]|nr:flavin reductase [Acidobacteriota bacterium]
MDAKLRKDVLRKLTYGLYVVTSRDRDDVAAAGVSWLSQCSFEPPLLMLALRKDGRLLEVLRRSGKGVVHILAETQEELAKDFFGPTRHEAGRINGHPYEMLQDLPVLPEVPLHAVVEARDWLDRGDHAVLVAEVVEVGRRAEMKRGLVLWDSPWIYGG